MSKTNGLLLLPLYFFLLVSTILRASSVSASSIPDQEKSFNRPDPLRHFKPYNGSYDIRDKHYWASAAFTGVHGYAMAGIWALFGFGLGTFIIAKNQNGSSVKIQNCLDSHQSGLFILVLLFTFFAIVASSFVLIANESTLRRITKLKHTILNLGGNAQRIILKVNKTLREMESLLLPYDPKTSKRLNSTTSQLEMKSEDVQNFVQTSGCTINLAIHTAYAAHLVVVLVNMIMLVAALAMLFLNWHYPGFITIIIICWILIAVCWVLTGLDFFFYQFADDTCSTFEKFEENPYNNSLSSILSCQANSDKFTADVGSTVHNFITMLNVKMADFNKKVGLDREEDTLPSLWKICNPFSGAPAYRYTPNECSNDTISIGDLPKVIAKFICYDSEGTCKGSTKLLPQASYFMLWSYSRSIQKLLDIYPNLQGLIKCSFVTETFSYIVSRQCRPLRGSIRLLWLSILCLSIFMVVLALLWVMKAGHNRGKCFSTSSGVPKDSAPL